MDTDTDRWPEIKELLDAALDLAPADRDAFLDSRCAGDEALRAELRTYLAAEDEVAAALPEEPLVDLLAARPPEGRKGQRLGAWRLESQIGRGGMGVVYLARRDDGVYDRHAAVKILKRGFDTGEIVRRFARERRILARLDSVNVARILDGGVTEDGLPFFVMEHVEGRQIDAYCRDLPLETILELFRTICEAVQVAHQSLVVHCDLKPANILVTADGVPKLLDFGIAKLLGPEGEAAETRALAEWRMGTPGYASPEQRSAEPITTASDVYALGALLYQLLTGGTPGGEATRPSAVSERWGRRLAGDLDNVVLKAIHPEPGRRYPSAAALADDVRRHLDHWPVTARPDSAVYRARRFVRRHPAGVATAGAVGALLAALVVVLLVSQRAVEAQRDRARHLLDTVLDVLASLDPTSESADVEAVAAALERTLRTELSSDPRDRALLLDRMGRIYHRMGFPDEARQRLEEALEIRRRAPGVEPEAVAASLTNLAHVLIEQGESGRVAQMLVEAIEIRQRHDPDDQGAMINTLTALAKEFEEEGRYAEAEAIYRDLLERRRGLYGEESEHFARGLNNLAVALLRQGELEEAESLFDRSLELWRALVGTESTDYVTTEVNYAVLLDARGDYRSAIKLQRHALSVRARLGETSKVLARGYGALAYSLLGSGRRDELAEAEALLRRAIGIYEEDPRHPHAFVFQRNLAATLIARGDPVAAETLARRVLDGSLETLAPGHWRVADARSVLGHALLAQGRRDEEVASLLTEALPIIRDATGERSRYTREARERCDAYASSHDS
ncbi:MAG TPA: serine/threonine-protein kinase [Thermoanaerobaculia bacterium]|jgi:serine/threonine-protein kinase